MPSAEQSTFADQNDIAMDSDAIDLAASPQQALLPDLAIDDVLSLQSRDRILAVVMDTAKSRVSISTFPGPEFLDTLIKTCIIKRAKQDCWLHPGTFHSDQTRPELLTALVAGGCICFGIQTVSRTGLLLQEVVRLSLERLVFVPFVFSGFCMLSEKLVRSGQQRHTRSAIFTSVHVVDRYRGNLWSQTKDGNCGKPVSTTLYSEVTSPMKCSDFSNSIFRRYGGSEHSTILCTRQFLLFQKMIKIR